MSSNPYLNGNFIIIPAHVLECAQLSANDKILFGYINSLANSKGFCYANNGYISNKLGVSPKTASRLISKLKSLGFIKVQHIVDHKTGEHIERRIYPNNNPVIFDEIQESIKSDDPSLCITDGITGGGIPTNEGGGIPTNEEYNIKDLKDNKIYKTTSKSKSVDNPKTPPEPTPEPPEPTPDNLDPKDPNFHTRYETEEQRHAEQHHTRNISNTNFENPAPRQKCAAVIAAEKRKQDFEKNKDPKVEQEYLAELKRLSGLASDKKNE